ncbi:MAG: SPOR domain-containing protein [Myxococcota bacterium]|nr:SPOR domain-containing protein [Myxococcota bacterium]
MSDLGIRHLEELQEQDDFRRVPPGVTVALVGLGVACVLFAGFALAGRTSQPAGAKPDPLGDLVADRSRAAIAFVPSATRTVTDLSPSEVTFPRLLSDGDKPSTALAAVRTTGSATAPPLGAVTAPAQPPPPTDRLTVVPLPAQSVLEATPLVTRPRDAMTKAATNAAQVELAHAPGGSAPAGHDGAYQLQVSSFHTQAEAQAFADQLRARGHKAYVVEAAVPGRGTWFRVRVGPFATQHAAAQYRTSFEAREYVVPFVVPPETTAKGH